MKKILSMILALLMTASSAVFASADEVLLTTAAPSENAIHAESAEFLQDVEIMKGKEDGNLALNDNIKRYEMALFVSRISTGWTDDAEWANSLVANGFTDLEGSGANNVIGAINYASSMGIIEGYGNGEFRPEKYITYQEALAMVVRTLGYKNLDWPWGYIEKAIELGITENVTDKAFTWDLNRGEVAQLIYNALNAEKKDGSTLAFDVFNMKQETIIITASDRVVYEKGGVLTEAGTVSFKTYNVANGELGVITYNAPATDFAFVDHDDDLAVGHIYKVLLNTDEEGNIEAAEDGTVVKDFTATEITVIKNENGETPIADAISGIKFASQTLRKADETVLFDNTKGSTKISKLGYGEQALILDWATGDILAQCTESDDYTYISEEGNFYKVAWYYNSEFDAYFQYKVNANGVVIGYEWLSDEELTEAIEKLETQIKKTRGYVGFTFAKSIKAPQQKTAYAELKLEKFADGETYLQGMFKEYALGVIRPIAKIECEECEETYAGYAIYNVKNNMTLGLEAEMGVLTTGTVIRDKASATVTCCPDHGVWFSGMEAPALAAGGEEFIIYNYNVFSGELDIVKTIEKKYGVLRAYSVTKDHADTRLGHNEKGMVLIDDNMLNLGYGKLKNTGFKNVDKKEVYRDGLAALYGQYVEYILVDDHIVSLRLAERDLTTDKYLIMQECVGATENGTFVVEAYSTAAVTAGKLARYLVNSVDGNVAGSRLYKAAELETGNLYYVTNYTINADGNAVVDIVKVGGYNEEGIFEYDENKVATADKRIEFTIDGYKVVDRDTKNLQENNGTYIVISKEKVESRAPIFVYSGAVVDSDWYVNGQILKNVTGVDVFVDYTRCVGFDERAHLHGMYQYQGGKTLELAIGEDAINTFFGADADLILPTEKYRVVEVVDLYTGEKVTKALRNLDKEYLVEGAVYVTIGNNVEDVYYDATIEEVIDAMAKTFFTEKQVDIFGRVAYTSSTYLFGAFTHTFEAGKTISAAEVQEALIEQTNYEDYMVNPARKLVDKVTSFVVNGSTFEALTADYATANAGTDAACAFIYDPATKAAVVYIGVNFVADEDTMEPVETDAPETPAPETEAPETLDVKVTFTLTPDADSTAPKAGQEIVIEIKATQKGLFVGNALALYDLTYDESVLTFLGFESDDKTLVENASSIFGDEGFDNELGTVVVSMNKESAVSLKGTVCYAVFKVNKKAAAGDTTEITMSSTVMNNSEEIGSTVIGTTITVVE